MISLLDQIQIGEIHLPNRIIMAPLTRLRALQNTFRRNTKYESLTKCDRSEANMRQVEFAVPILNDQICS
jgi:2,4-dienoyl-CoA reductase-like NADH-dependent reductase (Old Yellow Enzyme family)